MPAVFLRGTLPQSTASQIDITQAVSLQGISPGPVIWSEGFNNASLWTLSGSGSTVLQVNGSLSLNVLFPSRSTSQAVSVYHNISISLDQSPIVTARLQVSRGVSYGLRFWGVTVDNKPFTAWHEGSALQHRPGKGTPETILASLVTETSIPNPNLSLTGAKITRMALYVEAGPLIAGAFSMQVSSLWANSAQLTKSSSNEVSGNFTALVADLGPTITTKTLYQVFVGLDIRGSSDLSYVPYLTVGAGVAAQGYTYVTKIATTYELALLSPLLVNSSPLFSGSAHSSSLVVSAKTGMISFFHLDSISIRFFAKQTAVSASLDPGIARNLVFYFFIFLFVIPVATVILVVRVFKDED